MKKILTLGTIMLFIGLAFVPNINATASSISSKSNDLIELTVQIFGIEGVGKHTVQLTKEEANELGKLFDDLKIELDNSEDRRERIEIFKETIVSLSEINLLPEGVSVKELQDLVTEQLVKHDSQMLKSRNKLDNIVKAKMDDDENFNCLITGDTTNTCFFRDDRLKKTCISFSTYERRGYGWEEVPANGWVFTDGRNGVKKWTGEFHGIIPRFWPSISPSSLKGALDFVGICIIREYKWHNWHREFPLTGDSCFLGSALRVKIEPWPLPISMPKNKQLISLEAGIYVDNVKKISFPITIFVGDTNIEVDAEGASKVEFYLDDDEQPRYIDDEAPYEWLWDEFSFGKHTLTVKAYDNTGNSDIDEMTVWKFF